MSDQKLKNLEDLKFLGAKVADGFNNPEDKPDWFDPQKLQRGQKLARKNFIYIYFWYQFILVNGFALTNFTEILHFTGNSSSMAASRKRYAKTFLAMKTWLYSQGDIFDTKNECFKSLLAVRKMHNFYREKYAQVDIASDAQAKAMHEQKAGSSCPFLASEKTKNETPISQFDLALVQIAFITPLFFWNCLYKNFYSEGDLQDWIYLWRCFGYILGIEDEMNVCSSYEQAVYTFEQLFLENGEKLIFSPPTDKQLVLATAYCQGATVNSYMPKISIYTGIRMLYFLLQNYKVNPDLFDLPNWVDRYSSFSGQFHFYYYRVVLFILRCLPYSILDRLAFSLIKLVENKVRNA